ncbi:MAG: hypothetical protein PVH19_07045, partial [Planctomycetia bacterium]
MVTATGDVLPPDPLTWIPTTSTAVGDSGTGTFSIIAGGTVVDQSCVIGNQATGVGEVTIDGVGSTWINYNALGVGIYGSGTLDVLNGGLVQSVYGRLSEQAGSTGHVTVDGPGSAWINSESLGVGIYYGSAILDITNQGRVSVGELGIGSNGVVNLNGGILELTKNMDFYNWDGAFNFNSGEILVTNGMINAYEPTILNHAQTLTVTGGASGWNSSLMKVGCFGNGALNILNGGFVQNDDAYVGREAGSVGQALVDGNDSTWVCTNLRIGEYGSGILDVTNGGYVASVASYLGNQVGSTAEVTIDGPGSVWANSQVLQLGSNGPSTIHITNQGKLSVGQLQVQTYGTIDLDGGVLEFTESNNFNNWTGTFQFTGGEIRVANGGVVGPIAMALDTNQVLNVTGNNSFWASETLKVGDTGNGMMNITDSGSVQSGYGYIGNQTGSTGSVSIDGLGSRWLNQNSLHVGGLGSGTLSVTNGAWVTGNQIKIGAESGSVGQATVDGANSAMESGGLISVGYEGTGTLHVTNYAVARSNDCIYVGNYGNGTLNVSSGLINTSIFSVGYHNGATGQVTVHNGTLETNATYLGQEAGATGHVSIDGSDSLWINQYDLYVGKEGSGTLNITGGADLDSGNVYVGDRAGSTGQVIVENSQAMVGATIIGGETGAIGQVTVSGSDATWECPSDILVGGEGNGTLNIDSGASASCVSSEIGLGVGSTGQVAIDGANSSWAISNELYVGHYGDGTLSITHGAAVQMGASYIGRELDSTGQVLVDGIGSSLTANTILLGQNGLGRICVTNGATVTSYNTDIYSSELSNSLTVDGPGSTWIGQQLYAYGTMNITNGGMVNSMQVKIGNPTGLTAQTTVDGAGSILNSQYLGIGGANYQGGVLNITDQGTVSTSSLNIGFHGVLNLDGGTLELTNSMSFYDWEGDFNFTSGTIRVTNGTVHAYAPTILDTDQVLEVTGPNSAWYGETVKIGNYGDGTLDILDGGMINSMTSYLGYAPGSSGQATVNDGGWQFQNLHVGYYGEGLLVVENGTEMNNAGSLATSVYIGNQPGSTGTVLVRDANSSLLHTNLYVGRRGTGTLMVMDGAVAGGGNVILGDQPGSSGYVMVDGDSSRLEHGNALYVGRYGNGTIDVSGGATLDSHNVYGYLGYYAGSTGTVNLDGFYSQWTNNSNNILFIGYRGSGAVNVTNKANLATYETYLGNEVGSTGQVMVDNASWMNSNELYVGNYGNGSIDLTGGASVQNASLAYLGYHAGSTGMVTVNGNSSEWYSNGLLVIGHEGSGTFQVVNHGHFTTDDARLGEQAGATGQVTVQRGTWINNGDLDVGTFGAGSICLSDEAMLETHNVAYLGRYAGSAGTVTVDGTMTRWEHYGHLSVGYEGNGTVNVINHSTLSTSGADLGAEVGSTGQIVINDATLANNSSIEVGRYGEGTIHLSNGATLYSQGSSYLGHYAGSTGTVTIDGTGSNWDHNNSLAIGYEGSGTAYVTGGANVSTASTCLGSEIGSTGQVTVDSAWWTSNSDFSVGCKGNGLLNITNGGVVQANESVFVALRESASGTVCFDDGSLQIGQTLFAAPEDLTGTGTIYTHGLISDVDLVFDATHGSSQTLVLNDNPNQNVTIHLNVDGDGGMGAGYDGMGSMRIAEGSVISTSRGFIGFKIGSAGVVTVENEGSTWSNEIELYVGCDGSGTLMIEDKGLVSVAGVLTIDADGDGDSFINMASGGMLALYGDADDTLVDFLDLVQGTDAIQWWDESISDWASITTATQGFDYTLEYMTEGDLDGYTVLTVGGFSVIPGDANLNGIVDASDATIVAGNWQYGIGMAEPDATWMMG